MKRFILSRLISGMVVILVVLTGVFLLVRLTGNPGDALLPNFATEKEYQMLSKELGLDKPIYVQYWIFIKKLAIGDFGVSAGARLPVRDMLLQRMPNSLKLGAVSMLMVILGSFPLGVIAALKRGKLFDWVARIIVAIGQSVPSFVVGLFLMQLFSIHLRLFPVARMEGFSSYILPAFSLAFFGMAGITRLLRSSMIEILDSEYIKLARIKGLSETAVICKHALKNALISVVTYSGIYFALLVMGAVIVEAVFSWPGIGLMLWEGVLSRDFAVVQSIVVVLVGLVIAVNLIVDIIYLYIDPRIRYERD